MPRYTLKSSTVLVSEGSGTKVYRSVEEVPNEVVERFERAKSGIRPQTILIADPKGKEEIMRALQGLPSSVRPRWNSGLLRQTSAGSRSREQSRGGGQRKGLAGAAAGAGWSTGKVLVEAAIAAVVFGLIALAFSVRGV